MTCLACKCSPQRELCFARYQAELASNPAIWMVTEDALGPAFITDEHMAEIACKIKVGDRVLVVEMSDQAERHAEVMFVGKIPELANGYWVGVEYDMPVGKNDGSVKGRRCFECAPDFGGIVRPNHIRPDLAPPTGSKRRSSRASSQDGARTARLSHDGAPPPTLPNQELFTREKSAGGSRRSLAGAVTSTTPQVHQPALAAAPSAATAAVSTVPPSASAPSAAASPPATAAPPAAISPRAAPLSSRRSATPKRRPAEPDWIPQDAARWIPTAKPVSPPRSPPVTARPHRSGSPANTARGKGGQEALATWLRARRLGGPSAKTPRAHPGGKSGTKLASSRKVRTDLMSSSEVEQLEQAVLRKAAAIDGQAISIQTSTFGRKLGAALVEKLYPDLTYSAAQESILEEKKNKKLDRMADLVRTWDKNGDGDISKMEMRSLMRSEMNIKADNDEIDAFFMTIDRDGSGSLDLDEMKLALMKLLNLSISAVGEAAELRAKAQQLREKAAFVKQVAEATRACEQTELRLAEFRSKGLGKTVEAKIGEKIVYKNMKIGDVMKKWDKDGGGKLDKVEFREAVLEMGVDATAAELDEHFTKIDGNGNGELDAGEILAMLKRLTNAGLAMRDEEKELSNSSLSLRKVALKLQKDLDNRNAKEEKVAQEAQKAAAEATKAAEEARAAEAEERAARKAAAIAKRLSDKEANDALVEARRKKPATPPPTE